MSLNPGDDDSDKCYDFPPVSYRVLKPAAPDKVVGFSRHAKLPHDHHVQPEQRTAEEPLHSPGTSSNFVGVRQAAQQPIS